MYFTTSCVIFTVFITFQSLTVESLEFETREYTLVTVNRRLSNRVVDETPKYTTTSCGGIVTQAPGKITIEPKNVKCIWTIKAPVGYSVYISKYSTTIRNIHGEGIDDSNSWMNLQIFEGHDVLRGKPLFNSKYKAGLDHCISKGQELTVVLSFTDPENSRNEISLEYGFVQQSDISDILN